jgi:recombination protein RecT
MTLPSTTKNQLTAKDLFNRDAVKSKFAEMLGKRAPAFITSVLQIVASNKLLSNADPNSIYQAAAVAATLDLPLNNNLGFAYIIPFNDRDNGQVAQFQIGYRGLIQLSQRSGQFKTISATAIYEGQLIEQNPLTGFKFDFTKKLSDKVIGYAAYMELLNGFEKTVYMSIEDLTKHGKQYSQTFKKGFGLWKDNFEAMAIKTVLKLMLSKYAPLSIDMQKAVIYDQAIITDAETDNVRYIDNVEVAEVVSTLSDDLRAEWSEIASGCNSVEDVDHVIKSNKVTDKAILEILNERKTLLSNGK